MLLRARVYVFEYVCVCVCVCVFCLRSVFGYIGYVFYAALPAHCSIYFEATVSDIVGAVFVTEFRGLCAAVLDTVLVLIELTKFSVSVRFRCGCSNLIFVFISSLFAIFKTCVHSLEPGATPSYSASPRLQTMYNVLKFRKNMMRLSKNQFTGTATQPQITRANPEVMNIAMKIPFYVINLHNS